jgi:hypothetical protein
VSELQGIARYKFHEGRHLAHLGDRGEAILATGSVSGELLGEPSAELRANLAGSPVRLVTPFQSMSTPRSWLTTTRDPIRGKRQRSRT